MDEDCLPVKPIITKVKEEEWQKNEETAESLMPGVKKKKLV